MNCAIATLTIVDNYTRECLFIEVDGSLRGEHVVAALTRPAQHRPLPRYITTDNGSEFISKALDKWAYENGVEIDFSRPGEPTDNVRNAHRQGSQADHRDITRQTRTEISPPGPSR